MPFIAQGHSLIDTGRRTKCCGIGDTRTASFANDDVVGNIEGDVFTGAYLDGNLRGIDCRLVVLKSRYGNNCRGAQTVGVSNRVDDHHALFLRSDDQVGTVHFNACGLRGHTQVVDIAIRVFIIRQNRDLYSAALCRQLRGRNNVIARDGSLEQRVICDVDCQCST